MNPAHLHPTHREDIARLSHERPHAPCFTCGAHEHATTRISAVSPWEPAASASPHGTRYRRVPSPARLKCGARAQTRGSSPAAKNRRRASVYVACGTALDAGAGDGCLSHGYPRMYDNGVSPCLGQGKRDAQRVLTISSSSFPNCGPIASVSPRPRGKS